MLRERRKRSTSTGVSFVDASRRTLLWNLLKIWSVTFWCFIDADCPQVQAIYDYEAKQPDELDLQRGDVVKVFRKMADGKQNSHSTVHVLCIIIEFRRMPPDFM